MLLHAQAQASTVKHSRLSLKKVRLQLTRARMLFCSLLLHHQNGQHVISTTCGSLLISHLCMRTHIHPNASANFTMISNGKIISIHLYQSQDHQCLESTPFIKLLMVPNTEARLKHIHTLMVQDIPLIQTISASKFLILVQQLRFYRRTSTRLSYLILMILKLSTLIYMASHGRIQLVKVLMFTAMTIVETKLTTFNVLVTYVRG